MLTMSKAKTSNRGGYHYLLNISTTTATNI